MCRRIAAVAIVATILMLVVAPAGAITFGEPDENGHPYVGLLLADSLGDGTPRPQCSGTLIAPTVFLTAGHCTFSFSQRGITNVWVTFDTAFDPQTSTLIEADYWVTHPGFNPNSVFNDVGVVILRQEVQDVTPGALPPENLLSQMKAAGTLKNQAFVNVGYGMTAAFKGAPPTLTFDGVRRVSTSSYGSLTQNWLHLSANNDATGGGGTCGGDSGGPQFLGDSNLIVSVTSWGDNICRSLGMKQRLDTASVRAFLDEYVTPQ
jgi:secreted trypsin-like serine protease